MFNIKNMNIWDKEYSTSFSKEHYYLKDRGIRYSYVYTNEHGITVWKYTKTVELFKALMEFYENVYYK